MRRANRGFCGSLARLVLWLIIGFLARPAAAEITLWSAQRLLRDTAELPSPHDPGWRHTDLPHALHDDDSRATGAWFRFRFADPAAAQPHGAGRPREELGLYVFWANENAAFFFNGTFIGDGGRLRDPIARHWNAPFFFLLPAPLWRTENELLVHLRCDPGWGLLSPLRIGSAATLRSLYTWRHFLQVELARGLGIALLLASSLALSAWWWRRSDVQYLWFGLACLLWSVFSFYQGLHDVPAWPPTWLPTWLPIWLRGGPLFWPALFRWLAHLCLDAWSVCLLRFVLHHVQRPSPRMEALWMGWLLCTALLSAPHGLFWQGASFFLSHSLGLLFALGLWLRLRTLLRPHRLLRLSFALLLLAGLHDMLFALPWRLYPVWFHPIQLQHRFFAAHYAAPLVLLLLTRTMARRFVQSLVETETLNRELESRVAASTQALQDSYARRAQMERQSAAHAERERIYGDLHDDIGAMLLSLAIRAKDPHDADLARSALRNLRDVVSQAGQTQIPLVDLLADWRAEIMGRLGDAGLHLRWQQPDDLPSVAVSATAALNLGRILREAISNIVRHARAQQVHVAIAARDLAGPGYCITIVDDGSGSARGPGRGMRNMQSRAGLLGARISWDFGEQGCRVCLDVPADGLAARSDGD